jgi:predicted ATPase/DNA-binding NarL/FixJ family response regulator
VAASASRRAGNLPAEMTSFVNRRDEIAQISRLLSGARLVTLTGVAGVGKTRLAMQVAARLGRTFPGGVWLVELAFLRDGDLLAHTLVYTLGIHDTGGDPLASLTEFLRERHLLLVLDNCEHLTEPCATLALALLRAAGQVRILTTSREVLRLAGEHVYQVPPLPTAEQGSPPGATAGHHAVELFAHRASAVVPTFTLTAENHAEVAEVCRRLEGIPLAIELAAVRMRVLSVEQLRSRLDDRFHLLRSGQRSRVPHQRTLRAAVDWSFDLCTPAERAMWALVSVFAGGFDLAAVEEVHIAVGASGSAVVDVLDGLVGKSILTAEERDGQTWYGMLETLREYGRDRLRAAGDEPRVRRGHAERYLRLAEQAEREWFGPGQIGWFRRLDREHANLRAALESFHATPDCEAGQDALRLAAALWFHWVFSGRVAEGRLWLGRALASAAGPTRARARAMVAHALLAGVDGDLEAVTRLASGARDLAERLGDQLTVAQAITRQAAIPNFRGDTAAAQALLIEALARFAALGESDNPYAVFSLNMLIGVRGQEGDRAGSAEIGRQVVAICQARGDTTLLSSTLIHLARAAWLAGELPEAAAHVHEAVRLQRSMLAPTSLARGVEQLAWITAARDGHGEQELAALLLGAADRVWRRCGLIKLLHTPYYGPHHRECEAAIRAAIGDEAFEAAFRRGAGMDIEEIVSFVAGESSAPGGAGLAVGAGGNQPAVLSRRERQVAELVAEGLSNKQIAARLVISRRTVDSHVEKILTKLGFTSRVQVAAWFAANSGD